MEVLVSALPTIDPRITQAVIAGGFVAAGWVVNSWRNRVDARALRAEKLRDYHRALFAEIGTHMASLWDEAATARHTESLIARMEAEPDFVPFIPLEENDAVFDTLLPEIHILPRQTIDPIVAYYSQIKAITNLARDMRAEGFAAMGQPRRLAMYRDYLKMRVQAFEFGRYALEMIDAYSKGGKQAADAVSSRAKARSARSQGSE